MNYSTMNQFHDWLKKNDEHHRRALTLSAMLDDIPSYLGKMIRDDRYKSPGVCAPFVSVKLYKDYWPCFEPLFAYGEGQIELSVLCAKTEFTVGIEAREGKTEELGRRFLTDCGLLEEFRFDKNCENFPYPAYVKVFEFPGQEPALFDFLDNQLLPSFRKLKDCSVTGT